MAIFAIKHHKLGEIDDGSPIPFDDQGGCLCERAGGCPPLTIREKIADILGTLDDKIELNRRTNETLEAMARRSSRLGSWTSTGAGESRWPQNGRSGRRDRPAVSVGV